jgi:hypothetical protein
MNKDEFFSLPNPQELKNRNNLITSDDSITSEALLERE